MPRRGALLELSREHHAALVLARDCRRATSATAAVLRQRVEAHDREVLVDHFRTEEALLAQHASAIPASLARALLEDHAWLRAHARGPASPQALIDYGERLATHVRFEERTLWPLLQPLIDPG